MPTLRDDVAIALSRLAQHQAPPDASLLFKLVQEALSGLEVDLSRVKHVPNGRFLAKWHRKGGALTEETTFTLSEPVLAIATSDSLK